MVTNAMLVYSTVSETLMYYHYKTHNLLENETSFRARALPITLLYFWSIDVRESLTCGARDISDIIDARESDVWARLEPTLGARLRPQFSSSESPSSCE